MLSVFGEIKKTPAPLLYQDLSRISDCQILSLSGKFLKDNFLLLSNGVRPHSFSALMLFVYKTALVVIFEALYWIESIFSFAVGFADDQMGAAYSRMGLTMEIYVFRSVFGFDPKKNRKVS
ncbi:hypothetical protein TNCV_3785951 [Trichonephila clavipes]|nr:hypothetical protein TNCV_3785951 [Trichonephila clavipes]